MVTFKAVIKTYFLFLVLVTIDAVAQPGSGDIYREYVWLPDMVREQEKFLRVGGRLDYKIAKNHMPPQSHIRGFLSLDAYIDIQDAVRAEVTLEMVQSHEDTKGLAIQINEGEWISIADIPTLPQPQSNYMLHTYPTNAVPLKDLREGRQNRFRMKVDTSQAWNWPQNIFYAVIFRIYYKQAKLIYPPAKIAGLKAKATLKQLQDLFLESLYPDSIDRVDYFAQLNDFNWEGDGRYEQWHGHTHRGKLRNHLGSSQTSPYDIKWNTEWIPDQNKPIAVRAQVRYKNGLLQMTKPIGGLSLARDYSIKLCRPYHQPENWVTRSDSFSARFALHTPATAVTAYQVAWRSWSPCYGRGVYINGRKIWDREEPCYGYGEHLITVANSDGLVYGENTISTGKTPLIDGKMVHGMEVQYPGIMVKVKSRNRTPGQVIIREGTYETRSHFIVETPNAIYYYDKAGGGFSRMLDADGIDWIDYKTEPWDTYPASAASAYRGIPNLVYGSDDSGAGHPGHDQCRSQLLNEQTILTQSTSGSWSWKWEFFADHARLTMLEVADGEAYWFLYEGIPGGKFAPFSQYFGTNSGGPYRATPDFFAGDKIFGQWQWCYFGHEDVDRVLYVTMLDKDEHSDTFSYLGNSEKGVKSTDGMVVFGFGRADGAKPLMKGPNTFLLGFKEGLIESKEDHDEMQHFIRSLKQ
ncbi:MAG: hypothetical protein HKN76_22060 [Saprospiraceae bacterium]|nr:hypothetical protein [Saprospiraceae bacterium]